MVSVGRKYTRKITNFAEHFKKTRANLNENSITPVRSFPPNFRNSNSPRKTHQRNAEPVWHFGSEEQRNQKKTALLHFERPKTGKPVGTPTPTQASAGVSFLGCYLRFSRFTTSPFTPSLHQHSEACSDRLSVDFAQHLCRAQCTYILFLLGCCFCQSVRATEGFLLTG